MTTTLLPNDAKRPAPDSRAVSERNADSSASAIPGHTGRCECRGFCNRQRDTSQRSWPSVTDQQRPAVRNDGPPALLAQGFGSLFAEDPHIAEVDAPQLCVRLGLVEVRRPVTLPYRVRGENEYIRTRAIAPRDVLNQSHLLVRIYRKCIRSSLANRWLSNAPSRPPPPGGERDGNEENGSVSVHDKAPVDGRQINATAPTTHETTNN